MKKGIALLTAAALFVSMTACQKHSGGDTTAPTGEPSGATMTVALTHSYKSELLPLQNYMLLEQSGSKVLLSNSVEKGRYSYVLYDIDSGSMAEQVIDMENHANGAYIADDTVELFYQVWSDEEKRNHSYIITCDSEMNPISETEVSDLWRKAESPTPKWGIDSFDPLVWKKDADGNEYAGSNDGLWCKTPDNTLHQIEGISGCSELFFGKDGQMYAAYFSQTIKQIDMQNYTSETISLPNLPKQNDNNGLYAPGNSTYDFSYSDGISVYGVKLGEGTAEELVNWEDSDFSGNCSFRLLDDGRIVVGGGSYLLNTYVLTGRTQEEVDALQLISMVFPFDTWYGNDDYLTEMAHQFNREHDGYRITIRSTDPDNTGEGWDKLETDLLAGIIPDIIVGDGSGFHNYESLSDKGLFEDLRPWMERDPEFRKEDYLFNVFEALSYKGRMERIPFTVAAETYLAKASVLNGKERLAMEDLQNLPEDVMLFHSSRRNIAENSLFLELAGAYIDDTAGTCSFDSPEFIQLLELYGTLPMNAPVWNEDAYKDDKILLYHYHTLTPHGLHDAGNTFGTQDVAIAGVPFIGDAWGGGVIRVNCPLVMSSQSKYKELIWEFIKYSLREDNQRMLWADIPVNTALMEEMFRDECNDEPSTGSVNGVEYTSYPPTPEEAEAVIAFYKNLTYTGLSNTFITDIVREEAGMYFAGDCTAQEAAKRIQGRVSLYLSEAA